MRETIRREVGLDIKERSHSERQKLDITNSLKLKGCEVCGYADKTMLRFLDFDHIDPLMKREVISRMVKDNAYSADELLTEINKCRIVCRHCHIIHTKTQVRIRRK